MKLQHSLIAGACLAVCSLSSFAAGNLNAAACTNAVTDAAGAEALVANCAPAATLFIGGASTMKDVTIGILNNQVFDTAAMTPINIVDNATTSKTNVKAYVGKAKAGVGSLGGKLVYVVYNYNNGSAGGVSQLLGKPHKIGETVTAKIIPEADVPFIGPAKSTSVPGGTTANIYCGTAATTVASTATKVACNSHVTMQADMALSDVRAQELYAVYPAAAKGKPSTLTQTPLFLQSFGVSVSPKLYAAMQAAQGLTVGDATAAGQPNITKAQYASLISKGGKITSLADLIGAANIPAGDEAAVLKLARRDDLSGTQASSNIFFVNGQCGGNEKFDGLVAGDLKGIDTKIAKAGGLLGGLAIRQDVTDDTATLDVQANVTSGNVATALSSATDYAIGVVGTGSGSGLFLKIDGVSPNANGANFKNATATRAQLASGTYPFAMTMYSMYVTATMNKAANADKKAMVLAMQEGFKNSNLSNLSGIAYLDGAANGLAAQQAAVNRANGNNCSPLVKL